MVCIKNDVTTVESFDNKNEYLHMEFIFYPFVSCHEAPIGIDWPPLRYCPRRKL